jgi:beta-lactamase superfamily II metal-dependent hydrolase
MPPNSLNMLSDPPAADEVEVSIFGPGKGECVLVHLCDNRWIIVDSCIDQRTREIPALSYLERAGVVAEQAVELVVGTHAHDDHFAGISKVFEKCEAAQFVCSDAMTKEEFLALRRADAIAQAGLRKRAFSEYDEVFRLVRERSPSGPGFRPLKYAIEQRVLVPKSVNADARVIALSPSDEAVTRSRVALKSAYPEPGSSIKAIVIDPNELAVALWVEAADKAVLLGADLLRGPAGCGWIAVLATFNPDILASVFKIPHHGSITGHHDDVWSRLLKPNPVALLAPFRGGKNPLPDRDDRARILSLTPEAFITAGPRRPTLSSRGRREAAALGPLAQNARDPWGRAGHVRARSKRGETNWRVDFSAPAQHLSIT